MVDTNTVVAFAKLFQGSKTRFAVYLGEGKYVSIKKHLTLTEYHKHLEGEQSLLIYPFIPEAKVKWLVFDIDNGDALITAKRLRAHLKEKYSIDAYTEISKQKGYHVWVFFKEILESATTRKFAHLILKELNLSCEVFPKQDRPAEGPGSAINLPYFGKDVAQGKRVIVQDDGAPVELDKFLENINLISPELILKVIPQEPPELKPKESSYSTRRRTSSNTTKVYPCIANALANGVPLGMRHEWALYLASHFYRNGYNEELVRTFLLDWDKKNDEPIHDEAGNEFDKIIRDSKKYKYGKPRCEEPAFKHFCQQDCPRFGKKESQTHFNDSVVAGVNGYLCKVKKGYKKVTNFLLSPEKIYIMEDKELLEMDIIRGEDRRKITISQEALRSNILFKNALARGGWDLVFDENPVVLKALRFHLSLEFQKLSVEKDVVQSDVLSLLRQGVENGEISIADFTTSFGRAQTKIGRRVKDHVHLIPTLLLKFINSKGAVFENTYELLKNLRNQLTVELATAREKGITQRTWKIPVEQLADLEKVKIVEQEEESE